VSVEMTNDNQPVKKV